MAIKFKYDLAAVAPPSNDLTRKFGQGLVMQQQRGNQIGKERALDRFGDANSDMTSLIQDTLESGDLDPQSVQQLQGLQAGRMTVLGGGFNETQQQQFMQGYNRQAAGLLSNVRRKPKLTPQDAFNQGVVTRNGVDYIPSGNGWVPLKQPDQEQPKSLWENPAALKEYRGLAGDMLRGVDGDGLTGTPEEQLAKIDEMAKRLYEQAQSRFSGNQPAPMPSLGTGASLGTQQPGMRDSGIARYRPDVPPPTPTGKFDELGYAIMSDGSKADPRDSYQMDGSGTADSVMRYYHPNGTKKEQPSLEDMQQPLRNDWAETMGGRSFSYESQPDVGDQRVATQSPGVDQQLQAIEQQIQATNAIRGNNPRKTERLAQLRQEHERLLGERGAAPEIDPQLQSIEQQIRATNAITGSNPRKIARLEQLNQERERLLGARDQAQAPPGGTVQPQGVGQTQPTGMTPEELAGQQRLVNTMQGMAYPPSQEQVQPPRSDAYRPGTGQLELAQDPKAALRNKQMPNILRVLRDQGKFDDKQRQMLVDRYGLTQEAIAGLEAEESGRRQLSSTGQIINDGYVGDMRKSADDMASRTGRAQSFLAGDLGPRAPQADISGPSYRDPATGRPYDNRVGESISLSQQAQDRLEKTWAETDAAGAKYKAQREGQRQGLKDRKTNPIADPKQLEKDARQFSTDYNLYRKGEGRLSVKDYIKQRAAAGTLSKDLTAQLQENYGLDLSSEGLQDVVTDGVDITSQKGVAMDAAASKRDARSAYRQQLKYGWAAPRAAQPQGQVATSVAGAQVASGGRSGNAVPPTAGAPEAPDFNWLKSKSANTDKDRAFYSQAEKIYQGASKEVQDAMGVLLNPKSSTSALLEAYEYLKAQKIDVDQFDPY